VSWLEGKWITKRNGQDRFWVSAVTSHGVIAVQSSGAITFLNADALDGWVVENFEAHVAATN
jgi:hypothetical protein